MEETNPAFPHTADRDPICRRVVHGLKELGYDEGALKRDENFVLATEEGELQIPIDALVYLDRRPVLLVKCVRGHLSTRERAAVSLARLLAERPVPFAIVASETDAVVFDTVTGKPVSHGYGAFPTPADARQRARETAEILIPPAQRERERRIILTYYHLRCSVDLEPF